MKHDIPHDLEIDLAKLAARKAAEAYAQRFAKYDYKHRWSSETRLELSFTVMGKRLEGIMEVQARKLALELDVPFMFKVFQGQAIDIIEREAKDWIAKARRGELKDG
jgi:hypothetical protein